MAIMSLINRKEGLGNPQLVTWQISYAESRKTQQTCLILIYDQLSATITAMGGGFGNEFQSVITADQDYATALGQGYGASEPDCGFFNTA